MYELHEGFIIGPETKPYRYEVPETGIFRSLSMCKQGLPIHWSESTLEARLWLDNYVIETHDYGGASQYDVDQLNTSLEVSSISDMYTTIGYSGVSFSELERLVRLGKKKVTEDFAKGAPSWIGRVPADDEIAEALGYILSRLQ